MFPMIFQSLMGLKNQGVMVPSGTTQGNSYPTLLSFNQCTMKTLHPTLQDHKHIYPMCNV
jgi:hypothetical protein